MKNTRLTYLLGWYAKLAVDANTAENNAGTNNDQLDDTRIAQMIERHVLELAKQGGSNNGSLYAGDCGEGMKDCNGSCIPNDVAC